MAVQRKHVAVLAADVVGYTSLMETDEERTHARLMGVQSGLIDPSIARHGGRIVKNTGDGFLAAFDTSKDAVACAVEIQKGLVQAIDERESSPILFRMGLNFTEAIVEPHDIFGDGVNLAARLQASAEPGGIVLSATVADQLDSEQKRHLSDLGELRLKNMRRAVHAFGVGPGPGVAPRAAPLIAPANDWPSIVVLPFRLEPPDSPDAWFAEGIIEGIIHVLSGIENLFVISRGTSLAYAGGARDPRVVGRELGVRYTLSGAVRRTADRLRLFTELADATTGNVIRSDRREGAVGDLFDMQDRIASEVVASIAPAVRQQELARAMRKPPDSLTAYDLLLQALDLLYQLRQETFDKARGLLQQAMAHDPGYTPAYSHTALWHMFRMVQGWGNRQVEDDAAEAGRYAAAALERDRRDAVALAIHGHMLSATRRDYAQAMHFLDRAVEVGPSCHMAWTLSSATLGWMGEGKRAVEHATIAMRLSPLDPFAFFAENMLSLGHYVCEDYEQSIAWGRRAEAHNPMHTSNLRTLAGALVAQGDLAGARQVARRVLAADPGFTLARFAQRSPMSEGLMKVHLPRLRAAGLPD